MDRLERNISTEGGLSTFAARLQALPLQARYTPDDLLRPEWLLRRDGSFDMYYAPHNEVVNTSATIVMIGITPGWQQMELAFRACRQALAQGATLAEAAREAKRAARFAGAMRQHLIGMLEALALHRVVGVASAAELFADGCDALHTTSALRYPVFYRGRNYGGHSPALASVPFLHAFARQSLTQELGAFGRGSAPLVIPLGRAVEAALRPLADEGVLDASRCLWGFPHPSGANGHRHAQFAAAQTAMRETVLRFAAQR